MPTFNGTSTVTLTGSYTDASSTTTAEEKIAASRPITLTDGTAANNADLFYSTRAQHTSTVSYDLTGGLTDRFGNALTFIELREIRVINLSSTTGDLLVLQGNLMDILLNGTTPTADCPAGGVFFMASPIDGFATITSGVDDTLTIDAGANTISYDLFLIGTSA